MYNFLTLLRHGGDNLNCENIKEQKGTTECTVTLTAQVFTLITNEHLMISVNFHNNVLSQILFSF